MSEARRMVRIGGMSKPELLAALQHAGVELNVAARELLVHADFTTFEAEAIIEIAELTVAELGLSQGGTLAEITSRGAELGLTPCPLELGPHLRLQYLDQPEGHVGHPDTKHKAPPGSLTVISAPIAEDDKVPKGFYLRRIDGILWLRGYRCGADHVWAVQDYLVLAVQSE